MLTRSSELIHSGELTRIVRPGKTQQRSYFLLTTSWCSVRKTSCGETCYTTAAVWTLTYSSQSTCLMDGTLSWASWRTRFSSGMQRTWMCCVCCAAKRARTSSDGCKRLLKSADGYRKTKRWVSLTAEGICVLFWYEMFMPLIQRMTFIIFIAFQGWRLLRPRGSKQFTTPGN